MSTTCYRETLVVQNKNGKETRTLNTVLVYKFESRDNEKTNRVVVIVKAQFSLFSKEIVTNEVITRVYFPILENFDDTNMANEKGYDLWFSDAISSQVCDWFGFSGDHCSQKTFLLYKCPSVFRMSTFLNTFLQSSSTRKELEQETRMNAMTMIASKTIQSMQEKCILSKEAALMWETSFGDFLAERQSVLQNAAMGSKSSLDQVYLKEFLSIAEYYNRYRLSGCMVFGYEFFRLEKENTKRLSREKPSFPSVQELDLLRSVNHSGQKRKLFGVPFFA